MVAKAIKNKKFFFSSTSSKKNHHKKSTTTMRSKEQGGEDTSSGAGSATKMPAWEKLLLPLDFFPLPESVVIGKGREARDAPGTLKFRADINNNLERYKTSPRRMLKAKIVTEILKRQQLRCPQVGAFVKHDGERWWVLSEHDARENITASFRNRLHEKYTSSSKFKSAKRRQQKQDALRSKPSSKGPEQKNKVKKNARGKKNKRESPPHASSSSSSQHAAADHEQTIFADEILSSLVLLPFGDSTTKKNITEGGRTATTATTGAAREATSRPTFFFGEPSSTSLLLEDEERLENDDAAVVSSGEDDDLDSPSTSDHGFFPLSGGTTKFSGQELLQDVPALRTWSLGLLKQHLPVVHPHQHLVPASSSILVSDDSMFCGSPPTNNKGGGALAGPCLPSVLLSFDSLFSQSGAGWSLDDQGNQENDNLFEPVDPNVFDETIYEVGV